MSKTVLAVLNYFVELSQRGYGQKAYGAKKKKYIWAEGYGNAENPRGPRHKGNKGGSAKYFNEFRGRMCITGVLDGKIILGMGEGSV